MFTNPNREKTKRGILADILRVLFDLKKVANATSDSELDAAAIGASFCHGYFTAVMKKLEEEVKLQPDDIDRSDVEGMLQLLLSGLYTEAQVLEFYSLEADESGNSLRFWASTFCINVENNPVAKTLKPRNSLHGSISSWMHSPQVGGKVQ